MDDRWLGNEFQIFEATDKTDLEAAMVVLRGGTHINKTEAERMVWTILTPNDFLESKVKVKP